MKNLALLLLVMYVIRCDAQWQPLNGPEGSSSACLEKTSYGIFCGTGAGMYYSVNEGQSWQKLTTVQDLAFVDLLNINDTLIAVYGVYDIALFDVNYYSITTFDQGNSWTTPVLIENSFAGYGVLLFHQGNAITTAISDGPYISYDYGQSWTIVTSPNADQIWRTEFFGRYFFIQTLNTGTYHSEHLISIDGSLNWNLVDTMDNVIYSAMLDSALFYTIADTSGYHHIIRTFNYGQQWDSIFTLPDTVGCGLVVYDNVLYRFDNQSHYYITTDYGQTWAPSGTPHGVHFYDGITLSNGDELSVKNTSIVHYVPAVDTFYNSYTGMVAQTSNFVRSFNSKLYFCTGDLYSSSDGGITWSKQNTIIDRILNMVVSGDTIVCVSDNLVSHSTDNGLTWDTAYTPDFSSIDIPGLELINGKLYYSAMDNFFSNDLGETWDTLPALPAPTGGCSTGFDDGGYLRKDGNNLMLVTNDGQIFKYFPPINVWQHLTCFWSTGAHNGNYLYAVDTFMIMAGRAALLYTSNHGFSWSTATGNGLPLDANSNTIIPRSLVSKDGLWIGSCASVGIYGSADYGNNWFNIPTPSFSPRGVALQNNILYAGSVGESMWRRSGSFHQWNGKIYFDLNNNSVFDAGDQPFQEINVTAVPSSFISTTDTLGDFHLICDVAGDSLIPYFNSPYVHFNPSAYILDTTQLQNRDFIVNLDPMVSDFSVDLTNQTRFRPGFWSHLNAFISNVGTFDQPGQLEIIYPSQQLSFVFSQPIPDYLHGDTIRWNIDTLSVFHSSSILLEFATSTLVQIGDSISIQATVTPSVNDTFPSDNIYMLQDTVVGSFDPNDKTCLQGTKINIEQIQAGEGLDYIVRFQNTGTLAANQVRIIDTLNAYLDWSTFRVISYSHPVTWTLDQMGVLSFDFQNINLPDSNSNEILSHGYVKYSVKFRNAAAVGNTVINTAYIYFDFNPPVQTNTTATTVINNYILNTPTLNYTNTIRVIAYPNPASAVIHFDVKGDAGKKYLQIFNLIGEELIAGTIMGEKGEQDLSTLTNGLYFAKIVSSKGELIATIRFIVAKEE